MLLFKKVLQQNYQVIKLNELVCELGSTSFFHFHCVQRRIAHTIRVFFLAGCPANIILGAMRFQRLNATLDWLPYFPSISREYENIIS